VSAPSTVRLWGSFKLKAQRVSSVAPKQQNKQT
jgi:hypothetical protein